MAPETIAGSRRHARLTAATVALAVLAFVVDVRWGGLVVAELLYIFPALTGFWSDRRSYALFAGALVTLLSVAGLLVHADVAAAMLANRVICLAAVWTTVALCLAHQSD